MASFAESFRSVAGDSVSAVNTLAKIRENQELMGLAGGSVEGVNPRGAALSKKFQDIAKGGGDKKKQSDSFYLWLGALDGVRGRIHDLEGEIADELDALREIYGDDVVTGIANVYLTDEELEGLKTDDEKLNAMVEKCLDKDGALKSKYEDMDPRVASVLQKSHKVEHKLKPQLAEIEKEYEANGHELTEDLIQKTHNLAVEAGIEGSIELLTSSEVDTKIKAEVDDTAFETNYAASMGGGISSLD